MNETRQVPQNALDARSLDALLSLDVDSFLTDAAEADFIFQDASPQTRSFASKSFNKRFKRASFVAACAVVLFALFYIPYSTRPTDVPSSVVQIDKKRDEPSCFKFVSDDASNDASNDSHFWARGSRLCGSLTDKAFDSTCELYQETSQELVVRRLSLARIAVKYSAGTKLRPTKERSYCSIEEKSEKKVDVKENGEYTLAEDADVIRDVLSPSFAFSEEYECCDGLRLLSLDPVFRIAQRIYIQDRKEEARTGL